MPAECATKFVSWLRSAESERLLRCIMMRCQLDVHCHTTLSGHAHSTVRENAAYAASIGLGHIGVADHGPALPGGTHLFTFVNLWVLPDYIHGVRVFKGVEANICDANGNLDLPDELLKKMDFVIASMHRTVIAPSSRDDNTRALISAMENPHVHILGHPIDLWYEIDIEAVVKAAARTKTVFEVNNQSLKPSSVRFSGEAVFKDALHMCKVYSVQVLASSDAHYCEAVGKVDRAMELIVSAGIDESYVLNTDVNRFIAATCQKA